MVEQKQPKTNTNTTSKKKTTSLNPGAAVWKPPSYTQKKTTSVTPPSAPATNGGTTTQGKSAAAVTAATPATAATRTAASIVAGTGGKPSGASTSSTTNKAPPSAWGTSTAAATATTKPKPQASTTTTTTATSSTPTIATTKTTTTAATSTPTQAPPPVTGWGNKNVMAAIKAAPPTMVPPQPLLQASASSHSSSNKGGKQSSSRGERNRNGQQQHQKHQQQQQQRSSHPKQEQPSRPQQQQQTQQTAAPSATKTGGGSAWGPNGGNKHVIKAAPVPPPSGSSGANGSSTTAAKQPSSSAGTTAAAEVIPQAKASAPAASVPAEATAPSPAPAVVVESSWSKVAAKNKKAVATTSTPSAATTTTTTSVAPTKSHNKQQQQPQQGKGSSHPNQQQEQSQQQQQQHGHHHQGGNQHHNHNHHHHHHHHHHHKKEHGKRMEVTDATLFTNESNEQEDSNVNTTTKNQNGTTGGSPTNSSDTTVVTRFTADALLNLRQLFLESTSPIEEGSTSTNKDDYKEWIWNSLTRLEDINRQMNQPRCNKPYVYGGADSVSSDKQPRINKDGILVAPKGELIRKEGSEDPNIFINEHGQEVYVKPLEVNDEKRWKPKTAISKATGDVPDETKEDTDDEDEEAALLKQALSLLNKLTPTTFPKLAPLFVEQIIQSESLLGEGLKLLISKAQQEPHFCPMYAQVCLTISNTPLPFCPNEKKQGRTLKKMLLEECQHEFDLSQEAKVAKALETMVDPNDEEERQYRKQLIKHNYLGHMTFIGEIYKVDLASMKVMLMCLPILLTGDRNIHDKTASSSDGEAAVLLDDHPDTSDDIDEETIECFTKLMTTIGHRLEEEVIASEQSSKKKGVDHMETLNALWTRVHHLAHGPHCSNRIKFMLLDLMELRDNGWTARRKTETAKTLQDIRMEAALEMSPAQPPRGSLHRGTSSGSIRSLASGAASAAAAAVDKDGFTTIVAKTAKLPRSMSQGALRRSQSGGKLSGGGGGGGNGPNKLPHPPFRRSTSTDVMMAGGISPGNSFTRSPVRMPPKAGGGRDSKSSKGFSALQDSLPFDTIVETKTIATPKTTTGNESTKEKKSAESTLDLTKCEKKVKAILKEYLSNHDMQDAVLSFEEILLGASSSDDKEVAGAKCIETMIFVCMESSPSQVDQYTLLWKELLLKPIFTNNMILKGIRDPFEFVQDIMIDAPMARTILLNLMSHVLSSPVWNETSSSSTSSIAFMTHLPDEFIHHGKSADFAVKLCLASSASSGNPSEADLEVIKELMTDDETKTYGSVMEFVKEHSK